MIAFWGPIVAIVAAAFVVITMRLLGFELLAEIRQELVEQNNPAPAIVFARDAAGQPDLPGARHPHLIACRA